MGGRLKIEVKGAEGKACGRRGENTITRKVHTQLFTQPICIGCLLYVPGSGERIGKMGKVFSFEKLILQWGT